MNIRTFGPLTDLVGEGIVTELDVPISVATLRHTLTTRYPAIAQTPFRIAVDGVIVAEDYSITDDPREIALLPPFAGG